MKIVKLWALGKLSSDSQTKIFSVLSFIFRDKMGKEMNVMIKP